MSNELVEQATALLNKMVEDKEFCGDGNRNNSAVDFIIVFNIIKANESGIDPASIDDDELVWNYTNYLRTIAKNYDYNMIEHLERVTPYGKDWYNLDDHGLSLMVKYYM